MLHKVLAILCLIKDVVLEAAEFLLYVFAVIILTATVLSTILILVVSVFFMLPIILLTLAIKFLQGKAELTFEKRKRGGGYFIDLTIEGQKIEDYLTDKIDTVDSKMRKEKTKKKTNGKRKSTPKTKKEEKETPTKETPEKKD